MTMTNPYYKRFTLLTLVVTAVFASQTTYAQDVKEKQQVLIDNAQLISASVSMAGNDSYFGHDVKPKGLSATLSWETGWIETSAGCLSLGIFGKIGHVERDEASNHYALDRQQYVAGGLLGYHYSVVSNFELFARAKVGVDLGKFIGDDGSTTFNNLLLPKELEVGALYMFSRSLGMSLSSGYSSHWLSVGIVYRKL